MQIVNQPQRPDNMPADDQRQFARGATGKRDYGHSSNQSQSSKIGPINDSLTQNKAFAGDKNAAAKKKPQGYHMLSNNNSMVIRNSNSQ